MYNSMSIIKFISMFIRDILIKSNDNKTLGSVLDLGCGTGLTGKEIGKYCDYLEGVDLSKSMLEQARRTNAYNKLIYRDISDYLLVEELDFNYYVATDVFIYVGDLSNIFSLIKSRNKSSGKMVFSTEDTDGDTFVLGQSGRYSHSKKYIEGLCEKFNYSLCHFEYQKLRKENNDYIAAGLYLLEF